MKKLGFCLLLLCLAGCGSQPLINTSSLKLTPNLSVPVALVGIGVAVGVVMFIDPLAPNWEVEEAKLSESTYRLDMRMKRYHTGGAGESMQILRRRAEQLQREQGFGGYELLTYTEGIESQTLGARRVAEGTIRLVQRLEPVKAN